MPSKPLVLDRPQDWTGPEDCSVSIQAAHDGNQLYIGANIVDERLIEGSDSVTFLLDVRPTAARSADPRLRTGSFRVTAAPGSGAVHVEGLSEIGQPKLHHTEIKFGTGGYEVKVAIPMEVIDEFQPERHSIQVTAVVHDVDEPNQQPARVLWRGTSEVYQRNTNFGHFVLAP
jgi:hypothetical protein